MSAFALARPAGLPRVGISVSKAVGGAVVRNRVRRRIHGALLALPPALQFAGDVVFVARPVSATVPYARLAADVGEALERARVEGANSGR